MKTEFLLQFTLLLMVLLVTTSEGFFLEYPKKVLMDFFQSLKEKKEAKKKPHIQHYHLHYYPVVHPLSEPPSKAPSKHELEEIHNEHLAALGWSNHEYKYVPKSKIKISSSLSELWKDSLPWDHEELEADLLETVNHSEKEGVYVQIPFNQKIIIEHPHVEKKSKASLLSNFFHKILDSKNSIHS
ncbi:hypothetical protein ANTRET_LOCUS7806 [Anthophora retusa]